jgi:hypothetical protein
MSFAQSTRLLSGLAIFALTGCGSVLPGPGEPPAAPNKPLQLEIRASMAKVKLGESVTLTTTISNPNDRPVNIYLGPSYSGVCFVNASPLQARKDSDTWDGPSVLTTVWKTGFCGTSSYRLIVAVPAQGNVQYTTTGILKNGDKGLYLNFGGSAEYDHLTLPLAGPGKYALRMVHKIKSDMYHSWAWDDESRWVPKEHSIANGYAPNANAPKWSGELISNDITLEVSDGRRD